MDTLLLATKLKRPPLTPDLVARPRLHARLNENPGRGLTLVCAPAGYGKTTLVSEWCEGQAQRTAWVSLDANDNDLNLFLRYLVFALGSQFPGTFNEFLALLVSPQSAELQVLATAFVNQIDELGERVVLVLDDFHVIHNAVILEFLSILVKNLPPNLHLVISTRMDPLLPLARARATGNLVELRAADLRFTRQETATFVEHAAQTEIDAATLDLVEQRVLGWPVGLRLAMLSNRGMQDLANLDSTIRAGERLMVEYLMDQVLSVQSKAVQTFLLCTSLPDRFCASLAQALLDAAGAAENGAPDAVRVLQDVQRANLFLIPLDAEGEWFRYHPLFQEMARQHLERQMGAEEIAGLELRASEWHEENGLLEEALRGAIKGRDPARAARLVETHADTYFNREDWRTVERWLGQIPPEIAEHRPLLQLAQVWVWYLQWKLAGIPARLDAMEKNLAQGQVEPEDRDLVRGYVHALRVHFAFFAGNADDCLQHARAALDATPPRYRYLRGLALMYQAGALQMLDRGADGIAMLDAELDRDGYQLDQFTMRLLMGKGLVYLLDNQLYELTRWNDFYLNLAIKGNLAESTLWAHNLLGRIYYEWNQLDRALTHFSQTVELAYAANARGAHNAFFGLALTYQALGLEERANLAAERAREFALASQFPTLPYYNTAFEAQLAMRQGDVERAVRLAGDIGETFTPNVFIFIGIPELTKLAVLIAEGSPASLRAAGRLHAVLAEFCNRTHNKYYTVTLMALHAQLQAAEGKEMEALETLRAAIEPARETQRIRTFADLGKPMCDLVRKLAAREPQDKFLKQLLAACEPPPAATPKTDGGVRPLPELYEPLTARELQVLELLRTPLSGKEIADKLSISPLTARKHVANIYSKLGTTNRRAAIAAATEKGILSPA